MIKALLPALTLLFSAGGAGLHAQCTNTAYTSPYPSATYTPTCNGTPGTITTIGYAGEYSNVSVVSGTTYTFSSSISTDYLTITNDSGTPQAFGTTPVMWTATFTGTARFYTHTDAVCGTASVSRSRIVSCGGAPPASGCTTATYGLYPTTTYTPTCNGTPGTITTLGYAGEYSNVSVVAGTTYTFSSSIGTDYLTITNDSGTPQAFGTTPVMWTATFTGTARFYTHTNSSCGESSTFRSRIVSCNTPPPAVANDLCSGALPIACGATVNGTTVGATVDNVTGGTCGTGITAPGVWYSFTSPANGDATVSLCGSSYDTKISVFSGSCASLTCVGGNDDFCSLQSQLTFSATAGTTYYVLVHGFSSATGAFSLSLTCPVDPCANDMVAPSITCPGTQTANLGANCTFTLPSYTGLATGVTDNCTTPTVTQSPAIGASVSGNTTITLRATDGAGNSNSCTFSLNVSDVTAPSISCPGTITPAVLSPTNCTNALPDYRPFVNASDNCGAPTLSQTPVQGTIISGVQTVTVTVRATDAAGNSNSCTYMVPHVDVTPPTAVCRTTTVFLPPSGVYTLQNADVFNAMASSDNCGGVSVYSISPSMVDVNDAGTTVPVMVLVQDASGNVAGCTANISVEAGAALPEPWECSGINNASTSCSYNPVDDSFTIQTGGANNNLGTDNLGSINLDLCGDFELTVKIESITPNGYAGLLARESDAVGSKMVGMYSNFTNMVRWEARTLTNGNKAVNFFGKPAPYWLKLKRQGNMFFGYYSYNGASFSIVTAQMVPMSSCLDIGMAAFTNIPGTTAIAVFSNLSISGANPTIVELPTTEVEQAGVSRNITLFPNPAQDVVTLSFSELQFGEAGNTSSKLEFGGTVRLRNELGQLIETRQLEPGTERLDWNVSSLNPGLYFIEVQTEGEAPQTLRFVKAK